MWIVILLLNLRDLQNSVLYNYIDFVFSPEESTEEAAPVVREKKIPIHLSILCSCMMLPLSLMNCEVYVFLQNHMAEDVLSVARAVCQ